MSDEESVTSGEDFSASEEEWKQPTKNNQDSSVSSDFAEPSESSSKKSKAKTSRNETKKKLLPASKRNELYNKFKNEKSSQETKSLPKSLENILNNSQFKGKKQIRKTGAATSECESSLSSGDDHLIDPNELNLNSVFFQNIEENKSEVPEKPPAYDCNIGISLTQSSEEENDDDDEVPEIENVVEEAEKSESMDLIAQINKSSAKTVDFGKLSKFSNQLEMAKTHLKDFKSNDPPSTDLNISQLLNMGELGKPLPTKSKNKITKAKNNNVNSDSDWEEVEENITNEVIDSLKSDGVEITLALPTAERSKRSCKEIDIEACIKRKINRMKKEHQVYMHKTHLLCLIAHGNYINNVLNNPKLLSQSLKLIPSKACYPDGRINILYCEQISKWYKNKIALKDDSMYCSLKKTPDICVSLSLQIQNKAAICKRDYILIFIILLRSMGIQCRMIMSLQPAPIRPPQSELCTIKIKKPGPESQKKSTSSVNKKPTKSKTKRNKKQVDSSSSAESDESIIDDLVKPSEPALYKSNKVNEISPKKLRSTAKKAIGNLKIPQLDGNDDDANSKTRKRGRPSIKIKTLKGFAADASYVIEQSEEENFRSPSRKAIKIKEETKTPDIAHNSVNIARGSPSMVKKEVVKEPVSESNRRSDRQLTSVEQPSPRKTRSAIANALVNETEENIALQKRLKNKVVSKKRKLLNFSAACLSDESDTESTSAEVKDPPVISVFDRKDYVEKNKNDKLIEPRKVHFEKLQATENGTSKKGNSSKPVAKLSTKTTNVDLSDSKIKQEEKKSSKSNAGKINNSKAPKNINLKNEPSEPLNIKDKPNVSPSISGNSKAACTITTKQKPMDKTLTSKQNQPKTKGKSVSQAVKQQNSSEDDFAISPLKKVNGVTLSASVKNAVPQAISRVKRVDRRVLSTDNETEAAKKKKPKTTTDMWVEVYCEEEEKWVSIDLFHLKVHSIDAICRFATTPISYVLAWNNDSTIKDISARYCTQWNTVTRKMRVEKDWWNVALRKFIGKKTSRDIAEDRELDKIHLEKPLPTSISEFKNHPLYALKRHLLKFEAIYPPNAPSLGFIRNEPVYARECIHTLHSREIWVKQARVVKPFEKPYKIVTARPKWDRLTKTVIKDQPLEIFGHWQTMEYDPPTAENGIVPRNAYGNVELFKACMLPKKTVHLQLPGLNRVCKKLRIDCAPAVIGFDFHSGACHPTFDGFVVCEEFSEQVVEEWYKDQEEQERKEEEKYEKRVYGNWKRLIKGLLIRERLRAKYNFKETEDEKKAPAATKIKNK